MFSLFKNKLNNVFIWSSGRCGHCVGLKIRRSWIETNLLHIYIGEMSEWFKEHAWKVCILQKGIAGSNPALSA